MSYLLSKSRKDHPDKNGEVQKITPKTANWEYVGFEMYHLQEEQELTFEKISIYFLVQCPYTSS